MLYFIKGKEDPSDKYYYLLNGMEYSVGRKNADIVITDDQSISRTHAIIKVEGRLVTLTDCGSKYGTIYNGNKIHANTIIKLDDKDEIKFGIYNSIFVLQVLPTLVSAGSSLTIEEKEQLNENIKSLGGFFNNGWDSSCTHLTTQQIALTIKLLHALIDEKPLVTLEYWKKFSENIKFKKPPPKVEDFIPPLSDIILNEEYLRPNPMRKKLFINKTFVFNTEKTRLKMSSIIRKAGGNSFSFERHPLTLLQVSHSWKHYLFVTDDEGSKRVPETLQEIYEYLAKEKQRTIPIQEIALAIFISSCEKHCNPNFNRLEKVFLKQETNAFPESQNIPLALETQTQSNVNSQFPSTKQEIIIPQSVEEDVGCFYGDPQLKSQNYFNSTKPTLQNDDNPSKRRKLEEMPKQTVKVEEVNIMKTKSMENIAERPSTSIQISNTFKQTSNENVEEKPSVQDKTLKRKLKEDIEVLPKLKKINTKNNFKVQNFIDKPIANPFATMRMKIERPTLEKNPFARKPTKEVEIEDTELPSVPHTKDKVPPSDISIKPNTIIATLCKTYNETKICDISNVEWISKSTRNVKKLDVMEDLKNIYAAFKDTVIIEVLPATAKRNMTYDSVDSTLNKSESKNNFKKFQKVRPLKPQINIITPTVPRVANPKKSINICMVSNCDDEEISPLFKKSKQTKTKRFNF